MTRFEQLLPDNGFRAEVARRCIWQCANTIGKHACSTVPISVAASNVQASAAICTDVTMLLLLTDILDLGNLPARASHRNTCMPAVTGHILVMP